VIVLVGLLLAAVANLLPRTRPNLAIGFRTRSTLGNRRLWMDVHRTAGYVGVGLGLMMAMSGALLSKAAMQAVIGWGMLAGVVMFALFVCKHAAASQAPR
jgi:uncharacterized iron-regulated membrane protein